MAIRALDLFCGAGGSSWGAQAAGAEIAGGIDAWDVATHTFGDNFPDSIAVNARLKRRSGPGLLPGLTGVEIVLASPECTNHTCARGSRSRDEESQNTSLYVLNYLRAFRPRWVVIENVVQLRRWPRYGDLIKTLERSYRVTEQILDAADFGVPQSRRRLFILCDREQEPPDLSGKRWRGVRVAEEILDPEQRWAARPLFSPGRAVGTTERARRAIRELGEGIPFLLVYYGTDGGGGWQRLDRPLRTLTTLDRFGLVQWEADGPTLRMLQVPELRRAMGFGDGFKLDRGSRRDRIKLLGNGVCPPVMTQIIRSLCGSRALASTASRAARAGRR